MVQTADPSTSSTAPARTQHHHGRRSVQQLLDADGGPAVEQLEVEVARSGHGVLSEGLELGACKCRRQSGTEVIAATCHRWHGRARQWRAARYARPFDRRVRSARGAGERRRHPTSRRPVTSAARAAPLLLRVCAVACSVDKLETTWPGGVHDRPSRSRRLHRRGARDASALQRGLLAAAAQVPCLLFSLPAGALVDRVRRRPLLIATYLVGVRSAPGLTARRRSGRGAGFLAPLSRGGWRRDPGRCRLRRLPAGLRQPLTAAVGRLRWS